MRQVSIAVAALVVCSVLPGCSDTDEDPADLVAEACELFYPDFAQWPGTFEPPPEHLVEQWRDEAVEAADRARVAASIDEKWRDFDEAMSVGLDLRETELEVVRAGGNNMRLTQGQKDALKTIGLTCEPTA